LNPSYQPNLVKLTLLNYLFQASEPSVAFQPVKQCLHFDPDSKTCAKLFKSLKSLDKDVVKARNFISGSRYASASILLDPKPSASNPQPNGLLKKIRELIATNLESGRLPALPLADLERHSALLIQVLELTCTAHLKQSSKSASATCSQLLLLKPDSVVGLRSRGLDLLAETEYEQAVRVLSEAYEKSGRSDRDAKEDLQKAERELKKSKNKDYYKVLAVGADADERTIKKAYRKATLKAHPDKGGSEKKMAAVNEAYEILSNPELRARYDRGDDPNDSSGQQAWAQQGFNPFGGQGEQFFHQFFQGQAGGRGGGGSAGGHHFQARYG